MTRDPGDEHRGEYAAGEAHHGTPNPPGGDAPPGGRPIMRSDADVSPTGAESGVEGAATGADAGDATGAETGVERVGHDASAEIGELIGRLSVDEGMDRETRGRLLARLARLLGDAARRAGAAGLARGRLLADVLTAAAPHIPVRDLETLRAHHRGLEGEELADSLVRVACNATTAVGAAGGALAAAQFAAPPLLLTAPAQLAAETLVVAAIEVKLIAELHEVYGVRVQGSGTARAAAFLTAWTKRRGINPLEAGSFTNALGSAAKAALRKRLMRSLGRSLGTMGPFLTGAAAGAALNRTATKRVADAVRADLRRNTPAQPPAALFTVRSVPSPRTPLTRPDGPAQLDGPAQSDTAAKSDTAQPDGPGPQAPGDAPAGPLPPPGPAPGPAGQLPPPAPPPSEH
ncbi:hypothetical protein Arub01_54830 [Actinomadura rubrobrunea]|uniref:EcsC family protein n=1 Tax=Actinomadura rubrobrunea TaxID=115335 RepID=A0A9W6PZI5_9ACTN|nr:hypothetical protein [Actinomadura rubrobrunea]GLW67240.1 hypothetical protein Arub01_54830 [Actinomadura rubrobrunea]